MSELAKADKIIAVDFDGCVVTDEFPEIGEPINETISALKAEQEAGSRVILWTCRVGDRLQEAVDWCTERGLTFDAVNENLAERIAQYGTDTRKVSADEYWDDRARAMPPVESNKYCDGCKWWICEDGDDNRCCYLGSRGCLHAGRALRLGRAATRGCW